MTRLQSCLGCGQLVAPGPRCSACRRRRDTTYNATRPEHHGLYRTQAWRKLSAEVRAAESRCRWCLKPLPLGRRVADHIVPLVDRPDLALDRDNLAVACSGCNVRRGRNARISDPEAAPSERPSGLSVSDEMAAIFGVDR